MIYGTGRGTTGKVAEAVVEGMKAAGATAAAVRVQLFAPARARAADTIGVGSPVHFYREARYVTDFLPSLPSLEGKRAFVFCTCGMDRPGETLTRLSAGLAERGASVVGAQSFRSSMSYFPLRSRGLGNGDALPDENVLSSAREFGARMAAPPQQLEQSDLQHPSSLIRLKGRLLANMKLRKLVFPGVRLKLPDCTGYGSCLSRCQVNGIERDEGETIPYMTNTCVNCLECIDWCPRGAIQTDSRFKEWLSTLSYRLKIH